MRTARTVLACLLVAGVSVGCSRDDDDGSVALPDEAAERSDVATFVAPQGRYEVDLPSDWTFNERAGGVSARPGDADTPAIYVDYLPVGDEEFDLDSYVAEQFAESNVPVDVEEVDVPGASQARLVEQDFDDGGRTLLIALDADGADAVVVDILFAEGEMTAEEAVAIATSLRFGDDEGAQA